ncbi:sperm microtubule inner protein 11 [Discoglossus pictus]
MAFFGLTALGYEDPFRAARLHLEDQREETGRGTARSEKNEEGRIKLPALVPLNSYTSQKLYQERVRRNQTIRTPKETQRKPLTATQYYGWWMPRDPKVKLNQDHPWIQGPHYPVINSPMTRFVNHMALTNKDFSLF